MREVAGVTDPTRTFDYRRPIRRRNPWHVWLGIALWIVIALVITLALLIILSERGEPGFWDM
jgi:hypothetical protein